jgi:STE24 endopeptidase
LFLPLFNKFEPMDDKELENEIKALAIKSNFTLAGVFKIDASKRDKRLNAYFAGIGNSKRVALFDTLIQKLTKDEILAVLAHEFGHYKNKDLFKGLAIAALTLFVLCFVFGNLQINGLGNSAAIVAVQFLLLGGALSFVLSPLTNFLSKANEFGADDYALKMGYSNNLAAALTKLVEENRSFPKASSVYKLFHYTHPSPLERIERLER